MLSDMRLFFRVFNNIGGGTPFPPTPSCIVLGEGAVERVD